jgi:hypothetical protein
MRTPRASMGACMACTARAYPGAFDERALPGARRQLSKGRRHLRRGLLHAGRLRPTRQPRRQRCRLFGGALRCRPAVSRHAEWRTPATFFEPRSECRGCYRHGCASARSRASMRPPRRVSCPAAHAAAGAHSRAAGCRPAWRRWRYITLACMSLLRAPAHKACKSPILTINVPQEKALSTVHGKFAYKTLGSASCRRHVLFVHGLGSSSGPVFQVSTLLRHAVHAACTIHPSSMRAHTLHPQITFCTTASSVLCQDTRSRAQTSLPLNCRWYQRVLLSFSLLLSLSLSLALSREHTLTSTHTYTRAHIHTLSFKCCALAHTECAYVLTRTLAPHPPHRMHAGSFQTY